jgi:hypothetical protein
MATKRIKESLPQANYRTVIRRITVCEKSKTSKIEFHYITHTYSENNPNKNIQDAEISSACGKKHGKVLG